MNKTYQYKPVRFYAIVFILTWAFWIAAAVVGHGNTDSAAGISITLELLGLIAPSVVATCMVLFSGSRELKRDLRDKLVGLFRIKPSVITTATLLFGAVVMASILLSTLFGQSLDQFSFTEDFSFAGGGAMALLTLVLAAFFEEMGWRGYAEDSIAFYCSWFKESIIFGLLWAAWHLPLFLIPDTYHYLILQQNPWYAVNFVVSIPPMVFLFTWVYVKNERSIFACMIFHFFVNILQEKIAMTQQTKCVETIVVYLLAVAIVLLNRDLFFETRHVGRLLPEQRTS